MIKGFSERRGSKKAARASLPLYYVVNIISTNDEIKRIVTRILIVRKTCDCRSSGISFCSQRESVNLLIKNRMKLANIMNTIKMEIIQESLLFQTYYVKYNIKYLLKKIVFYSP
jgi:hypothetical protein